MSLVELPQRKGEPRVFIEPPGDIQSVLRRAHRALAALGDLEKVGGPIIIREKGQEVCPKRERSMAGLNWNKDGFRRKIASQGYEKVEREADYKALRGHARIEGEADYKDPKVKKVTTAEARKAKAEEIEAKKSPAGGWTRAQLAEWGVGWPPPKGWKKRLIGRAR